jgi:cytochrome P450
MTDTATSWGGWAPAIRDDPSGHFAEARARCPVQRVRLADGHLAWVVLGYDAARQALGDPRISKDMIAALAADGEVVAEGLPGPEFSRHMLNVDPPDHTRLRRLVSRAFVPGRIAALEPAIRAMASGLLDELSAGGPDATVDLIEGYAYPLPFGVIGELLGIPAADRPRLHGWFGVLLTGWAGDPPAAAVEASDGIVAYLGELVEAKRQSPADDLVSVLVAATEGDALTTQELLSSLFQLVVAGHDTTASLIGNGVVALLDHPGQLRALLADPAQLPAAIDELIRFTAPVPHATFRVTAESLTLDGVQIPAHEQVLVCLGSANRDPGRFPAPDVLDIGRGDGPNLGFGHGIHYCLGAPLARLEARVAFEELLGRYPGLRLAARRDALAWARGDGLVLRGLLSLPVVLGPDLRRGLSGVVAPRAGNPLHGGNSPLLLRARYPRSARGTGRHGMDRRLYVVQLAAS